MKHGLRILSVSLLVFLTSCDKAKAFIDPTGQAYGKPANQSAPAASATSTTSSSSSKPNSPAPAAPTPAGRSFDAPIRAPAAGRSIKPDDVLRQLPGIEFQDKDGNWTFKNGISRRGNTVASLVDSAGKPWGLAVGDLDLDGSDDAVVLMRLDRADEAPRWQACYLRNQDGRLFNTQTVPLPGSNGYRDVDILGTVVTLAPEGGGPSLQLSYSGGELKLSSP